MFTKKAFLVFCLLVGCAIAYGSTTLQATTGARTTADTSWLKGASAKPCTKYARPAEPLPGLGTLASPFGSVQLLLNSLQAGDVGCLLYSSSADFAENLKIPQGRSGTALAPIILRAQDPKLLEIVRGLGSKNLPVLDVDGTRYAVGYWLFENITFDHGSRAGLDNSYPVVFFHSEAGASNAVHHIAIRGSKFLNGRQSGLTLRGNVNNAYVFGNTFDNLMTNLTTPDEAHGISIKGRDGVSPGPNRLLIRNNLIVNFESDGVHCESGDYNLPLDSNDPEDITLEDNRIQVGPGLEFIRTGENAIDIKGCSYVTVRGVPIGKVGSDGLAGLNRSKLDGVTMLGSAGSALEIHNYSHDVLIEGTQIWDSCFGIVVSTPLMPSRNILIRNNLIRNLKKDCTTLTAGINIMRADNVDIHSNTIWDTGYRGIGACASDSNPADKCDGISIYNNIIGASQYWIMWDTRWVTGFSSNYNLFWNTAVTKNLHHRFGDGNANGLVLDLAGWRTATNQDGASQVVNPAFGDYTNWCLDPSSPGLNRGLTLSGNQATCAGGPDQGWVESDCGKCPP